MRVAIIAATFKRGYSYQENVWAEQLAKAGHEVRAFKGGKTDVSPVRVEGPGGSYELHEVKVRRLPRSAFWSRGLAPAVRDFRPDLIVVCGDKTFALPVARDRALLHAPLISTYSENLTMHEFDWRKRGISLKQRAWAIGFILARGVPIRAICRRSAMVVGNTPQARGILSRLFSRREWPAIDAKLIDMPLGFSPDHFRFDPDLRRRVRAELGLSEREVLVCASSRFSPEKEQSLHVIANALAGMMKSHGALRAIIVGFTDDPRYEAVSARIGEELDRLNAEFPGESRFLKHPFAERERLNELYNASDIAVFNRASISCQEALGTGLVGGFVDDGSLTHLITVPDQGVFFRSSDPSDLAAKLEGPVGKMENLSEGDREQFRRRLVQASGWLGYDRIIADILRRIDTGDVEPTSGRRGTFAAPVQ